MSETWTEYAVRFGSDGREAFTSEAKRDRQDAEYDARWLARMNWNVLIVGRTVTASDWLPVDTDGAK